MTADLPAPLQSKSPPMKSNIDATKSGPWRRQPDLFLGAPHRMAWHVGGNPEGEAWLLLHGGPGSGANPGLMAPLDLARQWAIAPDQRGSGASRPHGATRRNHTAALVSEYAPKDRKNLYIAICNGSIPLGSLLSAVLAILLLEHIG